MRFEGPRTSWNDDRGFGRLESGQGGAAPWGTATLVVIPAFLLRYLALAFLAHPLANSPTVL